MMLGLVYDCTEDSMSDVWRADASSKFVSAVTVRFNHKYKCVNLRRNNGGVDMFDAWKIDDSVAEHSSRGFQCIPRAWREECGRGMCVVIGAGGAHKCESHFMLIETSGRH